MELQSAAESVRLLDGMALTKHQKNTQYLMELDDENLLRNYRLEAGLIAFEIEIPADAFLGWEIPSSQLRGHILGHWMSAAAMSYAVDKDPRFKARIEYIVGELACCQRLNDGWCFSIPARYLERIRDGQYVWAAQYTCHKTLMGLLDAYRYAGVEKALEVAREAARWFLRYTDSITREQMNDIMERTETGGMLEVWAELYGITRLPEHRLLMERYERPLLYAELLSDDDPLAGMHANTIISEILGVCRAYEVTGEQRYYDAAKAYWCWATKKRGMFATGGQNCYEAWTQRHDLSGGLGMNTQEHCTAYNMMRLAGFFMRHEGDAAYGDYWERCLYNGIFAQGYFTPYYHHSQTWEGYRDEGLISYYLPLMAGSRMRWGTRRKDFWCCHGTLMQANARMLFEGEYYLSPRAVTVSQYLPSALHLQAAQLGLERDITLELRADRRKAFFDANALYMTLRVCGQGQRFALRLRVPTWLSAPAELSLNGAPVKARAEDGYLTLERDWADDTLALRFAKRVYMYPLEGEVGTAALCDGPIVLAGLTDASHTLRGDPAAFMHPLSDRVDGMWNAYWHTTGQGEQLTFTPLFNVGKATYTIYHTLQQDPVV